MAATGDVETFDSPTSFINHFVADNIKSLSKCKALQHSLLAQKQQLQERSLQTQTSPSDDSKKYSLEGKNLGEELKSINGTVSSLSLDIGSHSDSGDHSLEELDDLVVKANQVERCRAYLICLDHIEHASCTLQSALLEESIMKAINAYEEIVGLFEKMRESSCKNLVYFVTQTIKHWHGVLKEQINKDLGLLMKTMEWPFVTAISHQKTKPAAGVGDPQQITKNLSKLFKQLLRIQLPSGVSDGVNLHPMISSLPNYKETVLPISLLMEPLRKRFRYHFYGSKQTNNADKPEWFFTQLLTWAKDHTDYLSTVIQPALWDSGYDYVNANVEFLRCLQILAMEKLISCIPDTMYDDHQFSHLIHETLSFHSDMISIHDYPSDESSSIHILTAEEPFRKWIIIEKKFAQEKMDMMTESPTAWLSQYNADLDDDDEYKAAECAESFITLLNAITERYEPLPYPVCQLMFVCVKRELLEDYRIRLVQLRKEFTATSSQYLSILNTTHYIISVLREWVEQPFFLKLQYQKSLAGIDESSLSDMLNTQLSRNAAYQPPRAIDMSVIEDLECSLFDTSIQNIASLEEDMLKSLSNHILTDLKAKLRSYADNNRSMWTALNHLKHKDEQAMLTLSATACEFIIHLQKSLVLGKEGLHRQLFTRFWQQISQELDRLIFTMVICENHFSEGAVIQFNFDMTRNLFPIIGKYSSRPENFLKLVKESSQIMAMQLGDALLLKSTLAESLHSLDSQHVQDPVSTVQELGIFKLTPEDVELVLSRRNDLLRNF